MFLYLSSYQAYWSSLRGHYEKDNKIIIIIIPDSVHQILESRFGICPPFKQRNKNKTQGCLDVVKIMQCMFACSHWYCIPCMLQVALFGLLPAI